MVQLLTRLDLAIGRAQTQDVFTDEVRLGFTGPNIRYPVISGRPIPDA